jgi:hypothetical protein
MSLDFVAEVWDALREHIDFNDRKDAADTLINLLLDNNYETDDIKDSFRGDKDINSALKDYIQEHEDEFYEEEEEESDEDWD